MADDLQVLLKENGVLLEGHFLLTSGRHSGLYFEKFRILEHPALCEAFARRIADRFRDAGVTVVCGPTTGGIIIAYEVARQLGARCVIAEKGEKGRKVGRGFRLGEDDRVLVVDDVMTTGGSIVDTLEALAQFPSKVVGVGVFIDRSGGVHRLPSEHFAAYAQTVETFLADDCPFCREGLPLQAPGRSGK
jgi:orotate phosphoribosyltransferase